MVNKLFLVKEIPYQVNKAKLIEKIAELARDKKIEGITDLRDESDRNGMRIVMEIRKDANANVLLNNFISTQLCKQPLESICLHSRWTAKSIELEAMSVLLLRASKGCYPT